MNTGMKDPAATLPVAAGVKTASDGNQSDGNNKFSNLSAQCWECGEQFLCMFARVAFPDHDHSWLLPHLSDEGGAR